MLLGELRSPQWVDSESVTVREHGQPDKINDSGDGHPQHLRNGLIVEDGFGEVRVLARAEAEESDVAQQLGVVSGAIESLGRFWRSLHVLCYVSKPNC